MSSEFDDEDFTPLRVSTTTVTTEFPCPVNIIDVAKYLPIDDVVIGIKLVYARGASSIIRGVARISQKAKDFYNQVTFTVRLPLRESSGRSILVSCKIFHNGTLHVTGTHTLQEAVDACNLLLERLKRFRGCKMIRIVEEFPFLSSHDNLLFNSHGEVIGWINRSKQAVYLRNEYVTLESITIENDNADDDSDDDEKENDRTANDGKRHLVFVSSKWSDNAKRIYTLDGEQIGEKRLSFNFDMCRRHFEVKFGYIYSGNKIAGKEHTIWNEHHRQMLQDCRTFSRQLKNRGVLLHHMKALESEPESESEICDFREEHLKTHMINMFFKAPFKICRNRLHKTFLEQGYYSRFDPCSHAAVNLRFHFNQMTMNGADRGKCVKSLYGKTCTCKDISVSCFNSGKMNITGLATLAQGDVVYDFLRRFFTDNKKEIHSNEQLDLVSVTMNHHLQDIGEQFFAE